MRPQSDWEQKLQQEEHNGRVKDTWLMIIYFVVAICIAIIASFHS